MQSSSRAPVLSATRTRVSCWITAHLPYESCSPAAKRPSRKDAGSVRTRRVRARLRTQRDGALQRPGECEACGGGASYLPGLLQHLGQAPVFRLGQRPRLDDADGVPDARRVRLVVRVELRRPADDLLVLPVR